MFFARPSLSFVVFRWLASFWLLNGLSFSEHWQWRQREFKVGGDEPCEPTVRLPDWSEFVASYSRMKSAWGWTNGGQPILFGYIRKYVIVLGGYSRWRPSNQKIGGDVSPASPAGLTPVSIDNSMWESSNSVGCCLFETLYAYNVKIVVIMASDCHVNYCNWSVVI